MYDTAVQSQKAVSAYFPSKQILPFVFAEQNRLLGDQESITRDLDGGETGSVQDPIRPQTPINIWSSKPGNENQNSVKDIIGTRGESRI